MNLPALEVPQLVIAANKVYQHDGGIISTTSQLSSPAIAVKLDPDDAMLMKIDDKDCLDELVAFLAISALTLRDNIPFGRIAGTGGNNDMGTVRSKGLPSPDVRDAESVLRMMSEDPLRNDKLVRLNDQLQRRTRCLVVAVAFQPTAEEGEHEVYDCG